MTSGRAGSGRPSPGPRCAHYNPVTRRGEASSRIAPGSPGGRTRARSTRGAMMHDARVRELPGDRGERHLRQPIPIQGSVGRPGWTSRIAGPAQCTVMGCAVKARWPQVVATDGLRYSACPCGGQVAAARRPNHQAPVSWGDRLAIKPTLPIHNMEQRHFGLTKAIADSHTEAARVCLDRHHRSPTDFNLDRSGSRSAVVVQWQPPDERTRGAWANETDATEAGACTCALAAVDLIDDFVAVRRAEAMTGADYYLAPRSKSPDDLEDCLRLEVSGVDRGPESTISQRLRAKSAQASKGNSNLPALAGVVGFKARLIMLADL